MASMSNDSKTQHGYLLIADISGYTSYVASTELEHAQAVLGELLELLLATLTPALTLAKLEGDAVFVYAPESRLALAETVLELVETSYVTFRDRVEGIRQRTTCECNACRAIPTLDLKFIVHHGNYVIQRVAAITELVGSDVNLVHRLLKNHVSETTGYRGYVLITRQFLSHLEAPLQGTHEQVEMYEHLGDVYVSVMDMRARYAELNAARHIEVTAEEADIGWVRDFPQAAAVVWEWLNDPHKRSLWMEHRTWRAGLRPAGRPGPGASNHCTHGKDMSTETILDWKPFQYVTSHQKGKDFELVETIRLEPAPGGGTRIHDVIKMESTLPGWLRKPLFRFIIERLVKYKNNDVFDHLARLIADNDQGEASLGKE
jgi:class 3 adenylate cyclase